ncbi:MAG TPA: ATP-grasp domain-containing protein, partial [Actinopolymorphaceae bacterium]
LPRSPFLRHLYTSTVHDIDPRRTFLVEGMLTGREYAVDVVIRDGEIERLPLLDKFLLDERFFELGFVSPPIDLSRERETALLRAAEQAIVAHGLDNTVAHVELIDDGRLGPTIVEVNAGRPGGLPVCTLVQWMTGVDTFAEQVSAARGVPSPRTAPKLPIPLGGFLLFPERSGTLRAVHGLDDVREHADVVEAFSTVRPGDELTVDHEIPAVVVVVAGFADEDDLVETYGELRDLVEFEMES